MADCGGDHAAGTAAGGGDPDIAVGVAAANGAVENGGDAALAPAAAAANGAAEIGGNPPAAALAVEEAHGPAEDGGNPAAAAPAAEEAHGPVDDGANPAPPLAVAAAGGEAVGIPEEALHIVLLRMPAAEIARCRTICRLWRDLPNTKDFLGHHVMRDHVRSMPLVFYRPDHQAAPPGNQAVPVDGRVVRVNLRAVDIRGRAVLPVMRFSHLDPALPVGDPRVFRIEGSCDGVLLLSYDARLYACNPCTRRWARLPPLHRLGDIVGFYVVLFVDDGLGLGAEMEYRVLYHSGQDADRSYWIFPFFFPELPQEGRDIGRPADLEAVRLVLARGISPSRETPPVKAGRCLHWLPQPYQKVQNNSYVLVFNTDSEHGRFHWIPPPVVEEDGRVLQVKGDQLLEIDGRVAMTLVSPRLVQVWVLHDGPNNMGEFWVWTYRIDLPVAAIRDYRGYDVHGPQETLTAAVFVVSEGRNVLIQCTHALLQCDARGNVLQTYQLAGHCILLSGYLLQDSLVQPPVLQLRQGDAHNGDPPFFQAP
ncbi:hypothetical protein ACP70R_026873 [Stipagrostis hirtigluma subsp. patula]